MAVNKQRARLKELVDTPTFVDVVNQVLAEHKVSTDKWGEKQNVKCRELCAIRTGNDEVESIESDLFRLRATNARKQGLLARITRNGKGQPKQQEKPEWYRDYLSTAHWDYVRGLCKESWQVCVLCMSDKNTEVHHRTYERIGNERITDVVLLCGKCHKRHHKYMRSTPKQKPSNGYGDEASLFTEEGRKYS